MSNPTSSKLKSTGCGFVLSAPDLRTGVSSRNISFFAACKYAAVPFVLPYFDAVAKPSISPSDNKSKTVAN